MSDKYQELTREQLYELVWSEPIPAIAERFSVFESDIVKWCKSLNVPKPPPSYWARARHGLKVTRKPPLPALKGADEKSLTHFVDSAPPAPNDRSPTAQAKRVIQRRELEEQVKRGARETESRVRNQKFIELRRLNLQAKCWDAANQVRAYLDAAEGAFKSGDLEVRKERQFKDWLSSSRQLMDEVDPLTGGWGELPPGYAGALGSNFNSYRMSDEAWLWSKKAKRKRKEKVK